MSIRILQGDCRDVLKTLPDQSVHCVVTSPPYFGLRSYGVGAENGEIGSEPTPAEYVATMVEVFREVWRVLRDDGTLWLNLGDGYASQGGTGQTRHWDGREKNLETQSHRRAPSGQIKPGDLIGIPWRVAFALQDNGWYLRQDNIWAKRNCMPESIRNRTTRAHEYMFQLTKSGSPLFWTHRDKPGVRSKPEPDYRWVHKTTRLEMAQMPADWDTHEHVRKMWRRVNLWEGNNYFYDATAIEEDATTDDMRRPYGSQGAWELDGRPVEQRPNGKLRTAGNKSHKYVSEYEASDTEEHRTKAGLLKVADKPWPTRNKRSVWWIATQPYRESHFAVMPAALVEPCILAGTSERGCCRECGAPWVRQVERIDTGMKQKAADGWDTGPGGHGTIHRAGREKGQSGAPVMANKTAGWLPSCSCAAGEPVPCTVLDPFGGAGTTALVCDRLQRDAILIELNTGYAAMAERRIRGDAGLFAEVG